MPVLILLFLCVAVSSAEKGGWKYPADCNQNNCQLYSTWTVTGDAVEFELEAGSDGWIAIGLSADKFMGTEGIDDVLGCQLDEDDNTKIYAKDLYNPQNQKTYRHNEINDNQYAIKKLASSYTNGRLYCKFTRLIITNNTAQDRHLNDSWWIFLARGVEKGTSDSHLLFHKQKEISPVKLNVSSGQSASGAACINVLYRLHGIFMYISFGILLPLGIFMAANMQEALPKFWFLIHRIFVLSSLLFSCVGFVLIFVVNRSNPVPGLIDFGPNNPKSSAHLIIGVVVLALQLINPIIGLIRCKKASSKRIIFYVLHAVFIGYLVQLLGAVNLVLGVLRYVKLVDTKLINVIFWILIGTLSIYTIFDLFVYLLKRTCITHKTPRGHEDLEKPLLTDHETSISKKRAVIMKMLMIVALFILILPGLAMIVLIGIACF